jgi:hypothetical protein
LLPQGKRQKKAGKRGENLRPAKHSKIGGIMKRKKTKRKPQQSYDVQKAIDAIEKIAVAATKVYRVLKLAKAMLANGRKTK